MDFPLFKKKGIFSRYLVLMLPLLLFAGWFGCAAPSAYQTPPHQQRYYSQSTPARQPHRHSSTALRPVRQPSSTVPRHSVPDTPRFIAGSELSQPWDLSRLPRRSASANPYLLVSDVQEKSDTGQEIIQSVPNVGVPLRGAPLRKTAPPKVSIESFLTPVKQTVPHPSSSTSPFPVLNLGRDLLHELMPSNERKWSQNHAVMPTADINGNTVTVKNIRYSKYESAERYTTRYYDASFNLDEIRSIDLIVVPFRATPRLAHIQTSFGFADGRHLGLSIEARYEEGEKYDALGSALRQFELIYVFADERDLIRIGTDVNKNEVHLYRLKFEPNEVREMFLDAVQRANKLARQPEFYHPLRNSCVTNLIAHINKGRPQAIPKEYRTLLPGLLDSYVYDLKLVNTAEKDFKQAKENAKVNWLVEKYGDLEYFSAGIRQNMY